MVKSEKMLHMFCQKPNVTNKKYMTQFESYVTALESYGVFFPIHPGLLTVKLKAMKVANV